MQKQYKFNEEDILRILAQYVGREEDIRGNYSANMTLVADQKTNTCTAVLEVKKNAN